MRGVNCAGEARCLTHCCACCRPGPRWRGAWCERCPLVLAQSLSSRATSAGPPPPPCLACTALRPKLATLPRFPTLCPPSPQPPSPRWPHASSSEAPAVPRSRPAAGRPRVLRRRPRQQVLHLRVCDKCVICVICENMRKYNNDANELCNIPGPPPSGRGPRRRRGRSWPGGPAGTERAASHARWPGPWTAQLQQRPRPPLAGNPNVPLCL